MTRVAAGVLLVLLVLAGAGCSRDLVPEPSGSAGSSGAASVDAARTKLALALQDPCASAEARSVWPRCGRWVEEMAGIARGASQGLPGDAAVGRSADAVGAGRDAFTSRGCAGSSATPPPDIGACVGAMMTAQRATGDLASALRVAP